MVVLTAGFSVVHAVPTVYTDEALYLSDLASMGYVTSSDGFEGNNFWGLLEPTATMTVPDVTSKGVTWTGLGGGVDLINSAKRSGSWALKSAPEGSPSDGFLVTAEEPMFGFGGWVRAGNSGAGGANDVSLFLNGSTTAEDVTSFNSSYQFIGVIDPAGISSFQFETEPVEPPEPGSGDPIDPSKTVNLDDFTFGFASAPSKREPGTHWTNAVGGIYDTGANWAGGSKPLPADNALFHLGSASAYTVNFTQNQTASQAAIANDKVAFDLGGFQYDLTEPNITRESLIVGERPNDVGELTITNGTVAGVNTVVAHSTTSTGHLTLDTGGALTLTGAMRVGSGGTGTLDVQNGAVLTSTADNFIGQLGGGGTVNIDGPGSQWTLTGFDNSITLGSGGGTGELNITNGASASARIVTAGVLSYNGLNSDTPGYGTVNLDGAGTTLTANGIIIAQDGAGSMNVTGGAQITGTSGRIGVEADGDVILDGPGSSWVMNIGGSSHGTLYVGVGDQIGNFISFPAPPLHTGTMTIRNGASVTAEQTFVGMTRTGRGVLTVTGVGSSWNSGSQFSGNTFIGFEGDGELNVLAGATIQTGQAFVGRGGVRDRLKGVANIDGPGSAWNSSSTIWVGFNNDPLIFSGSSSFVAEGNLNVTNGGTVTATQLGIAGRKISIGKVNITDPGSTVAVNSVSLGKTSTTVIPFGSNAELNVSNSGLLDVTGDINVYHGAINLDQGTINAANVILRGAQLIDPGNLSDSGDKTVSLSGVGQINANVDNLGGTVSPGFSPGILDINGGYTQAIDANLAIEVAGLTPGTGHDLLAVTGTTTLDGTLDLTILDTAFAPTLGDSFDVLTASAVTGAFFDVTGTLISGTTRFDVTYLPDRVRVVVVATAPHLAGDLDDDGFVGIADLNLILSRWNKASPAGVWPLGDVSSDGFIGIEDLNAVLGNWNAGTRPSTDTTTEVPEPTILTFYLIGSGILARRR